MYNTILYYLSTSSCACKYRFLLCSYLETQCIDINIALNPPLGYGIKARMYIHGTNCLLQIIMLDLDIRNVMECRLLKSGNTVLIPRATDIYKHQ